MNKNQSVQVPSSFNSYGDNPLEIEAFSIVKASLFKIVYDLK